MKHFFFITLLMALPAILHAQQIKEITAKADNERIIVNCRLETPVPCSLQLQYSGNGGLTWDECKTVEGDIANQTSGLKTLYWHCLEDNVIMGSFIFRVLLRPAISLENKPTETAGKTKPEKEEKERPQGHFALLPGCAFGNAVSYSLMAGYLKKWGGYIKVKTSFGGKDKNAIEGDTDDAFFNGNAKKGRFSFYAGTIGQLHPNILLYAGIGYGNKWLQWETVDHQVIEIESSSYSGIDPEVGILFKIKMFTVGGGFSCLIGQGHKSGEGNISVGLMF